MALIRGSQISGSVASASYALTASYVASAGTFPYTGSAEITGSLSVTGSIDSTVQIAGGIFIHPKVLKQNIVVYEDYVGSLIGPVGISGSVTIESNATLYIIEYNNTYNI